VKTACFPEGITSGGTQFETIIGINTVSRLKLRVHAVKKTCFFTGGV
jgi:hypothetical protein